MTQVSFQKEKLSRVWLADFGDHTDVVIAAGPCTKFLDIASEGDKALLLSISQEATDKSVCKLTRVVEESDGAWYHITSWKKQEVNLTVLLCSEVLSIFGEYPSEIYVT